VKDFVAALHKLSIHCNFGPYLKTALRIRLFLDYPVFGLNRDYWTKELTFEKAVQVATAMKLSEQDSRQLQTGTTVVEYVDTKSHKSENRGKEETDSRKVKQGEKRAEASKCR